MFLPLCEYSLSARASQAMPTKLTNVKIALLDFNLQKHKLQMGVSVVVTDTKQVAEIRQREMVPISTVFTTIISTTRLTHTSSTVPCSSVQDITKEKIMKILDAGLYHQYHTIPYHTFLLLKVPCI